MMLCRKLAEADLEAYRALRLRSLKNHPLDFAADHDDEAAWPLARWLERLTAAHTFVVEESGALIACASLRLLDGRKIKHNGWINAMYVAPEKRGSGASDLVMDAIERQARQLELSMLKLQVRPDNVPAERFYTRRGFVAFGREPASHIVDGVAYDSLEMWKLLT